MDSGIIIIAGQSTPIARMKYYANVIIGLPLDFKQQDAAILMKLEEDNLYKFEATGKKYRDIIAYSFLHKVLPDMLNNSVEELGKVVYDYRFNMGSIENCSFVYPKMVELADKLSILYKKKKCEILSLSSVGPAFFAITQDDKNKEYIIKFMESLNMRVISTKIFNSKYIIKNI